MKPEPAIQLGVPAIEMHGVDVDSMKDPGAHLLGDVNWTVKTGEFWVVAGGQRSGKTDFLMLTGGLMPPTHGSYRFLGLEMPIFDEQHLPQRLKLGFVFDGGQLFTRMTVGENVTLPLRYHRNLPPDAALQEMLPLLEALELERVLNSHPATLGWGFQQRVGLARALALRPEVLLVDNPLSGLDVVHANWWLNFLDQLSRGHEWMSGKPVTLVVTTDELRLWQGGDRRYACLAAEHLLVLGDWAAVERCPEPAVQTLLRERQRAVEPARA